MATENPTKYETVSPSDEFELKGQDSLNKDDSVTIEESEDDLRFLDLLDPDRDAESKTNFWADVTKKCQQVQPDGCKFNQEQAIDEVRADNIVLHFEPKKIDVVVTMMTEWYDRYEKAVGNAQLFPGFERQISKLAIIIINREYKCTYEYNQSVPPRKRRKCKYSLPLIVSSTSAIKKTILQLAAEGYKNRNETTNKDSNAWNRLFQRFKELCCRGCFEFPDNRSYKRNFVSIAKCILDNDPLTWETASPIPLQSALEYRDDNMAALLVSRMSLKAKIRRIFETRPGSLPLFRFQDIIADPSMKKTVIAVLDATFHEDWPYQPSKKNEDNVKLHIIKDDPVRYHFHYRILDGDIDGRAAKKRRYDGETSRDPLTESEACLPNPDFNHRSISCLQALCQSEHKIAIYHPTVRSLVRRKWKLYGKLRIRLYAFMYLMFLTLLTLSLSLAVISTKPEKYLTKQDHFRGFCEVSTIIATFIYITLEFDQLKKEGFTTYRRNVFNLFDIAGLFGILILVPLRFTRSNSQWVVATIVFILNFLRFYKYFPAWKAVGIYSKTLSILFKKDLKVFILVYMVVLMTFCGATFLSLRGAIDYDSSSGFGSLEISGFGDIFRRGILSLAQAQGFHMSYNGYSVFSMIVIITSMFVIMIFLVNILIAQLSASYSKACQEATEQYDVNKALFVARLDNSRFRWRNLRIKYYVDGSYEYNQKQIKKLMSKWDAVHREVHISSRHEWFKPT